MFDSATQLLFPLLEPLAAGASDDWEPVREAMRVVEEVEGDLMEVEEDLVLIVETEAREELGELLAAWASGERLRPTHDRGVLKRAVKAFRKRLKLQRLDQESRLGGPFSKGERSGITGVEPPDTYGPEVWAELVRTGRLIDAGHRILELPPE